VLPKKRAKRSRLTRCCSQANLPPTALLAPAIPTGGSHVSTPVQPTVLCEGGVRVLSVGDTTRLAHHVAEATWPHQFKEDSWATRQCTGGHQRPRSRTHPGNEPTRNPDRYHACLRSGADADHPGQRGSGGASHLYASSVSGPGALTDDLIEVVAAKGGLRPNGRRRIPAARRPRADQRAISRASNRGACHGEAAW
jgi:hypothetical protein